MFERITEETFAEIFPLLEAAFPITELREKEEQRRLLKKPCYSLLGIREKDVFAAVLAAWDLGGFLYIEHFAVKETLRNTGLGGRLLDAFLEEKKSPLVLEVELPENPLTQRRIAFYERHGLVYNDYPYMQPPLRRGQGLLPLRLMTMPERIDRETYERYKGRIYQTVYEYEEEQEETVL